MNDESKKLRELADAIDRHELEMSWLNQYGNNTEVRVTFSSAGSCPGYKEACALLETELRAEWPSRLELLKTRSAERLRHVRFMNEQ